MTSDRGIRPWSPGQEQGSERPDIIDITEEEWQAHRALELWGPKSSASRRWFASTMRACVRGSRWQQALAVFEDAKSRRMELSSADCSLALLACGQGKQWQRALALLFQEMIAQGLETATEDFNAAIQSCEANQKWELAVLLMHRMQVLGPPPDSSSFTSVIAAVSRGFGVGTGEGRWSLALALLQDMLRPEVGSADRLGAVPTVQTWGAVIACCARARHWSRAMEVFHDMQQAGVEPSPICLHAALSACERGRNWQAALDLVERHWDLTIHSGILGLSTFILACEIGGVSHIVQDRCFRELQRLAEENLWAGVEELGRPAHAAHYGNRNQTFQSAFSPFAPGLLYRNDCASSGLLRNFRRWTLRPVEHSLRLLHTSSDFAARQCQGIQDERLCNINDLWPEMTRESLEALGLRGLEPKSPFRPALRRSLWWQIGRLPLDPEGYFVTAFLAYSLHCEATGLHLRSPGRLVRWQAWESQGQEPCKSALAPINMIKDRMQHRGAHAERAALLALTFRLLSRQSRRLGVSRSQESRPPGKDRCRQLRGTVWLHASHTPCMSCMASICQFQGLFQRLRVSVTFDCWQDWRPIAADPWDSP